VLTNQQEVYYLTLQEKITMAPPEAGDSLQATIGEKNVKKINP
jgi:hypothetical protein